ncbi:MAG: MaoC family dehydratase [Actinomycetota bacterium]
MTLESRTFTISDEHIRAYSRRGNYHSEPATAAALGLPGLVAQGTHAFGPAYGIALHRFGDEFLAHGELEVKFVGIVTAGDTIEARVSFAAADDAIIEVMNATTGRVAVVGTARPRAVS